MSEPIKAEEFKQFAAGVANRIETASAREEMDACVPIVHKGIDRAFGTKTDHDGNAWPPRKDKKPHPLEVKSGKMKAAALGGAGGIVAVSEREAAIGVDSSSAGVIYALRQQLGFTGPDSLGRTFNHPPRPFVGATEDTLQECIDIVADGMLTKIFG